MKRFQYPIINSIVLIVTLFVNYWSNTGAINGQTIALISQKNENLFTPAGYAFAIWGIIYLSLIALVVYQWILTVKKKTEPLKQIGYYLALANILNAIWVLIWLSEYLLFSVGIMISILITLTVLSIQLSKWSTTTSNFWLVKFPIYLYQGWIIVALVANTSVFLTSVGFEMAFSESVWAVVLLIAAGVIYIYETFKLEQVISALVGIWGLIAVGYKQISVSEVVGITAFGVAGILVAFTVWTIFRKTQVI
ncbi:hypothetical protein [Marinoscillum pacificum]|uniref:hypothetical protein n=1 Tax=Marinoscillum pacificum TaxID=392723 RepID=UPI0021581607|nr:hypothetical protein [Marinoscillum pacificum]